jgi:Polyketide cyclase / dehydrase and lipid transport
MLSVSRRCRHSFAAQLRRARAQHSGTPVAQQVPRTERATMGTLLVAFLTVSTGVIDPSFVRIGGHDGVEVYLRKDTGAIELAAVGEFDAPPAEVQAALLDYGSHVRVNSHLAESTVLTRHAGEELVYQHLKLPVIKDRDFTLRVTWHEGEPRGIAFSIDGAHGPTATKKAVRMSVLDGRWDLEPIRDGNATRAVYHVQIDFAGSVPRWMVRGGAAKDLPGVYIGMRRLVVERRGGAVGASAHR